MGASRCFVLLAVACGAGGVLAQDSTPLPKTMSGRCVAVVPGRQTYADTIAVILDAPAGTGAVTGRLTVRGVSCGAIEEPLTGIWDGHDLRFESRVRPNVNASLVNAQCASGRVTFRLTRKPGQSGFEVDFMREGMQAPGQVTLAP
jgi:hypothetical protein